MTGPRDEEGLDPESWDAMRALGHRMVDDMMGYLEQVRDRPAWQPVPDSAKAALDRPLPRLPEGAEQAYADFVTHVLPLEKAPEAYANFLQREGGMVKVRTSAGAPISSSCPARIASSRSRS